jgi:predicted CoA-binding protein
MKGTPMNSPEQEDKNIKEVLNSAHNIAVVGISDSPERDSNSVAAYLKRQGYRIIPVNPKYDTVLGEKCYASLSDIPDKVDVVDIFRRPEHVLPIVEEAIKINAPAVWMQLGCENKEAVELAQNAGLTVVADRCMKVEHRRHIS